MRIFFSVDCHRHNLSWWSQRVDRQHYPADVLSNCVYGFTQSGRVCTGCFCVPEPNKWIEKDRDKKARVAQRKGKGDQIKAILDTFHALNQACMENRLGLFEGDTLRLQTLVSKTNLTRQTACLLFVHNCERDFCKTAVSNVQIVRHFCSERNLKMRDLILPETPSVTRQQNKHKRGLHCGISEL